MHQACGNCSSPILKGLCKSCRTVSYCSVKCQAHAWKSGHREFCTSYRKARDKEKFTEAISDFWKGSFTNVLVGQQLHGIGNYGSPALKTALLNSGDLEQMEETALEILKIVCTSFCSPTNGFVPPSEVAMPVPYLLKAKKSRHATAEVVSYCNNDCVLDTLYSHAHNPANRGLGVQHRRVYLAGLPISICFLTLMSVTGERFNQYFSGMEVAGPVIMWAVYGETNPYGLAGIDRQQVAYPAPVQLSPEILDEKFMKLICLQALVQYEIETSPEDRQYEKLGACRTEVLPDNHCHYCVPLVVRSRNHPMKKCAGCRLAYYCNENCQRADWKRHKPTCYKQRTCHHCAAPTPKKCCTECMGVYYCNDECKSADWSSHRLKCPLQASVRYCRRCGPGAWDERCRQKKCARCKLARYCSTECQRADWIDHKNECVPVIDH